MDPAGGGQEVHLKIADSGFIPVTGAKEQGAHHRHHCREHPNDGGHDEQDRQVEHEELAAAPPKQRLLVVEQFADLRRHF